MIRLNPYTESIYYDRNEMLEYNAPSHLGAWNRINVPDSV